MMKSLRILPSTLLAVIVAVVVTPAWSQGPGTSMLPKEAPKAAPTPVPVPGALIGETPAAQPAPEPVAPAVPVDPNRKLGVGDMVSFAIAEDHEPPIALRVTDSGELEIPYIGRVGVLGKTTSSAAAEIKRRLEADYYYMATVRLGIDTVNRTTSVGRINIAGAVRAPGVIGVMSGEKLTISAAILKAGGFTQFGDQRKVKITRKGGKSVTVDVKEVLENGRVSDDLVLDDGDYVYVPQRLITW